MESRYIDAQLENLIDLMFEDFEKSENIAKLLTVIKVKAAQKYDGIVAQGYSEDRAASEVKDWLERIKEVLSQAGKYNPDGTVVNPNAAAILTSIINQSNTPLPEIEQEEIIEEAVEEAPVEEEAVEEEIPVEESTAPVLEEVPAEVTVKECSKAAKCNKALKIIAAVASFAVAGYALYKIITFLM